MSRSRFIFIIFYVTAAMILTVHLRVDSARAFNHCRAAYIEQARLKQQLWQKQIELESLINPNAIKSTDDSTNSVN